ncbi:hypothetical protein ABIE21_003649 [Conyzicola nivalis]|uniref:MmyB-like transcription regulator ligand binding domain-containing protein n=1 Tax=Conyzicola nivalis TaxID=1477021 RepID=A0ABV2QSR3_9MICO
MMNFSGRDDRTPTYMESGMVSGEGVVEFLHSWDGVAATLIDRHLNVSGSSRLAEALFPSLRMGTNLAREMFLEVIPRRAYASAEDLSYQVVAALHASLAWHEDDAEFEKIVGELSAMSRAFSTAWAADRQQLRPHGVLQATHQSAGELTIRYQLLELAGGSNAILIVWRGADPESEHALKQLVLAS